MQRAGRVEVKPHAAKRKTANNVRPAFPTYLAVVVVVVVAVVVAVAVVVVVVVVVVVAVVGGEGWWSRGRLVGPLGAVRLVVRILALTWPSGGLEG
ncbi:unnamed protein product [Boreogadus saida]